MCGGRGGGECWKNGRGHWNLGKIARAPSSPPVFAPATSRLPLATPHSPPLASHSSLPLSSRRACAVFSLCRYPSHRSPLFVASAVAAPPPLPAAPIPGPWLRVPGLARARGRGVVSARSLLTRKRHPNHLRSLGRYGNGRRGRGKALEAQARARAVDVAVTRTDLPPHLPCVDPPANLPPPSLPPRPARRSARFNRLPAPHHRLARVFSSAAALDELSSVSSLGISTADWIGIGIGLLVFSANGERTGAGKGA